MMVCVLFHDSSPISFCRRYRKPPTASLKRKSNDLEGPNIGLANTSPSIPVGLINSPIESLFQLLYCLIDRERCRPLARWKFLVGVEILRDEEDTAGHHRGVGHLPVVIGI